jgi:hypothetical protein
MEVLVRKRAADEFRWFFDTNRKASPVCADKTECARRPCAPLSGKSVVAFLMWRSASTPPEHGSSEG